MARPTKRTPETEAKLLRNLRAGLTRGAACGQAGISDETLARWLKSSVGFVEQVRLAENEAAAKYETVILRAADNDPKYALEWLRRRRREDWGDNVSVDLDRRFENALANLHAGTKAQVAAED